MTIKNLIFDDILTPAQKALRDKHGSPAEFAAACYQCVPGAISMDEAQTAIEEYNREWREAGRSQQAS